MTQEIIRPAIATVIALALMSFLEHPAGLFHPKNQESQTQDQNIVVVTGARFAYPLIEHWIEAYSKVNPDVQVIIESRGTTDPLKVDIIAEVLDPGDELRKGREYIYVARYAVLPVANSTSSLARTYTEKGLNTDLIKQIFFDDMFTDKSKQKTIDAPYTVYTRLQKAGVPTVFSNFFGYEQKDLKGIAIAGADVHLLRALLRDSLAVTYLPLPLIYHPDSRDLVEGLAVLPVDINGNKKVSDDEKIYHTIDSVIETLESRDQDKVSNIPIGYLHLSVDKRQATEEAIDFMRWVNEHGQEHLHTFGYLTAEANRFQKDTFNEFASQRR